jgi:hypothetical protein
MPLDELSEELFASQAPEAPAIHRVLFAQIK